MSSKSYLIQSAKSVRGDPSIVESIVEGTITKLTAEQMGNPEKLGNYTFYNASSLKEIEIPESVTSLGVNCLYGTGLTEITLPENLEVLENYAVSNTYSLKTVNILGNLKRVGENALTSLNSSLYTTYGNVTYIGKGDNPYYAAVKANVTSADPTAVIHKDCEVMADKLFGAYPSYNYIENFIIEDGSKIETLPRDLLNNCSKLKTLVIPKNIRTIESGLRYGYSYADLTEIIFQNENPLVVKGQILPSENYLSKLQKVKIENLKVYCESDFTSYPPGFFKNGVLICDKDDNNIIQNSTLQIPEGTAKIGSFVFAQNSSSTNLGIENVIVPNSVQSIGLKSFQNLYTLKSITLPFVGVEKDYTETNSLISGFYRIFSEYINDVNTNLKLLETINITDSEIIPYYAFNGYKPTEFDVNITSNLKRVREYAFKESTVRYINFQAGVEHIEAWAFTDCNSLREITLPRNLKTLGSSAFDNCASLSYIGFDSVELEDHQHSRFDGSGANNSEIIINIGEDVKIIPSTLFTNLGTSVNIDLYNSNIERIHSTTFGYDNFVDTDLKFSSKIIYIGKNAFYSCNITSLSFDEGIEPLEIDRYAFAKCSNLKTINLPANLSAIGGHTFEDCANIQSINFNGTMQRMTELRQQANDNLFSDPQYIHCIDGDILIR